MNSQEFDRALENISDPLIQEAAQVYEKSGRRRRRNKRVLRLTAIAAAVAILLTALSFWPAGEENYVTGPGLLVVRAYGAENDSSIPVEGVILEEGVTFATDVVYNPYISYRQHFPISFFVDDAQYAGMEITLEVNTNAGIFYKNEPFNPSHLSLSYAEQALVNYYGQHFFVDIDKKLYWEPGGFDYEQLKELMKNGDSDPLNHTNPHFFNQNPSFIDVIIRADGNIIGYCVIEIREINGKTGLTLMEFSFELLTMVSFPKVEGRWQKVTTEYVQSEFDRIHQEREELI